MVPPDLTAARGNVGAESVHQGLSTKTASLATTSAFLKRSFLILCLPSHDARARGHPVLKTAPAGSAVPDAAPTGSSRILIA